MLTTIGIALNFVGTIVLLGSDVKFIERVLKRCDPIHYIYDRSMDHIISISIDDQMVKNKRAHPYEGPVYPDAWRWWPMSHFLNRHTEQDICSNSKIDIRGGWFKIDGEQLTFHERRIIQLNENERLDTGKTLSLNAVYGLLYEARKKRIYIYGVSLLAFGFLFQLIDSLNILDILYESIPAEYIPSILHRQF